MARGISLQEAGKRYIKKSIMAYLSGGKNTSEKWIIGILESSGGGLEKIKSAILECKRYGGKERYDFLARHYGIENSP